MADHFKKSKSGKNQEKNKMCIELVKSISLKNTPC